MKNFMRLNQCSYIYTHTYIYITEDADIVIKVNLRTNLGYNPNKWLKYMVK